jgi:hypothetical protein
MLSACTGSLQPHGPRIRRLFFAFASLTALLSVATSGVARAEPGLEPGEAYVTRFSGTTSEAGKKAIDTVGTVGSVVDIRNPAQAPRGQHWLNEPQHDPVTAGEVGQVFGVALDDSETPNVYLTATSAWSAQAWTLRKAAAPRFMLTSIGWRSECWNLEHATCWPASLPLF